MAALAGRWWAGPVLGLAAGGTGVLAGAVSLWLFVPAGVLLLAGVRVQDREIMRMAAAQAAERGGGSGA